jgi:hypothetical protein
MFKTGKSTAYNSKKREKRNDNYSLLLWILHILHISQTQEMYKLPVTPITSNTAYLNVSIGHIWNLEGNIALGSEYHVTLLCIVNVCLGHLRVAKTTSKNRMYLNVFFYKTLLHLPPLRLKCV